MQRNGVVLPKMTHYAHSLEGQPEDRWHRLADHLVVVAELCAASASKFNAAGLGYLAGLLHDLGKYAARFQLRLRDPSVKVGHAFAGADWLMTGAKGDVTLRQLLAHAIAGHHAGLHDGTGADALFERLRDLPDYGTAWQGELPEPALPQLPAGFKPVRKIGAFQLQMLGRFVFSCLIDADRCDTEAFYAKAGGIEVDRTWPALQVLLPEALAQLDATVAARRAKAVQLGDIRTRIFDTVRAAGAERAPGVYTLTVPTGGGKTLSSMAFAMEHARQHKLDRIVYVMPFTAIIDQTAEELRQVFGEQAVLEHHSAIEDERPAKGSEAPQQRDKLRRAMEDWAAPVIATTGVQLFESLFSERPSRCRKLHNLARSVIVLDEAQTIPLHVLRPCVLALDELARNYGATVLLCTATQPALSRQAGFTDGFDLPPDREIAPDPAALAQALRRTTIHHAGTMSDAQLVDALAATEQGLVIVNSRTHALELYRAVVAAGLEGAVHLTTRQYPADRRRILAAIRQRLAEGRPCRLIATSLVEAGVDLDFRRVWRAEAGLEQVLQAAGRCNRENRHDAEESIVTVFVPEKHRPPPEIRQLAQHFAGTARQFPDLTAPAAIEHYFRQLYWAKDEQLDLLTLRDGEKLTVRDAFAFDGSTIRFRYRTVGESFRLIQSAMKPVIVALEPQPQAVLAQLASDAVSVGRVARELQPYTVQIPPAALHRMCAAGHIRMEYLDRLGDQFPTLVTGSLYREDTGLLWEDGDYLQVEQYLM